MKRLATWMGMGLCLLLVLPALAQDSDDLLQKARNLERRAGKLLDQGKRAEAFELLAQAAELRDKVRNPADRSDKQNAKAKAGKKAGEKAPPGKASMAALQRMQAALKGNDMNSARGAGVEAHRLLSAWAAQLSSRQNRLRKRVEAIEKQIAELRKLMHNSK